MNPPYPNGTILTLSGSATLSLHAPAGHWLVFNENGKGATYNAPRFLETDEVTERPRPDSEMVRFGYTFGGWYADAACTVEFEFGKTISELTNVYAKWNPVEKANYTVIIWKQNVDGETYDFVSPSYTFEGTVGNTVADENTVTRKNDTTVSVNGKDISFTGFHVDADKCNTVVEIKPEGNAVVNVYFDRNEYTLTFQDYVVAYTATNSTDSFPTQYGLVDGNYVELIRHNEGTWSKPKYYWIYNDGFMSQGPRYTGTRYTRSYGLQTIKTITGLYQQDISSNISDSRLCRICLGTSEQPVLYNR